jgi:hypothetical protein
MPVGPKEALICVSRVPNSEKGGESMMAYIRPWAVLACIGCLTASALVVAPLLATLQGDEARTRRRAVEESADPALERTREQVKMLDDLYKNAVVSITKRYVNDQDEQPAIMVAQDVFGAMRKQGWHSAKLVDATGEPVNEGNAPKTDFEKEAAREINSGKPYFDRVVGEGKDRRLLAATVVPVVMQKCAECHPHKQVGEVLGFIRYDIPIE